MEHVILVNERDEELGMMEKMEAHEKGLLHRAISVFLFNGKGQMLLQQRANDKYHSGGLWTNACCSHPRPGEEPAVAARRRLNEELGIDAPLSKAFDFVYRAELENGLTEHELDHVFMGTYNGAVRPDPCEVRDYCYQSVSEIEAALETHPQKYTVWFRLAFPRIREQISKEMLI